jgi:hypothetical protein
MSEEKVKAVEVEVQRAARCESDQRGEVSSLAGQHYTSEEEEWKVENVCRFHGFEQGMQER